MLRSLTKLGRPSTKLLLNNNALSPCSTVLQNRWVDFKNEVNTLIAIGPVSAEVPHEYACWQLVLAEAKKKHHPSWFCRKKNVYLCTAFFLSKFFSRCTVFDLSTVPIRIRIVVFLLSWCEIVSLLALCLTCYAACHCLFDICTHRSKSVHISWNQVFRS